MDERELVWRAQKGEEEAFSILVKRYEKKVFNLAYSFARDRAIADDLAQEVFIKAYFALPRFRFQSEFGTWLYRVTINQVKDYLRKKTRRREVSLDLVEKTYGLEEDESLKKEMEQTEEQKRALVWQILQSLPLKYRMILTLRDVQGLSYQEITRILKISQGTVDSRIHRARKLLQKKMAPFLSQQGGGNEM